MDINIELDSFNKNYNAGEFITGNVLITSNEKSFEFDQINISLTGNYTIKNNKVTPPSVNIVKFFYKKMKLSDGGKM